MKISVVTISYNQDKFLEQCILSVKNQTYKNFEHIIVDAGSSDRSRKIINKYKNYFSKVIFEKDRGPADGLNKGFRYATGSIYFFLNSDDLIPKNSFMLAINEFKKNDTKNFNEEWSNKLLNDMKNQGIANGIIVVSKSALPSDFDQTDGYVERHGNSIVIIPLVFPLIHTIVSKIRSILILKARENNDHEIPEVMKKCWANLNSPNFILPIKTMVSQIRAMETLFKKERETFERTSANKDRTIKQIQNNLVSMITSFTRNVGDIFPQDLLSYKEDNLLEESLSSKILHKKEEIINNSQKKERSTESDLSEDFSNIIKINIHKEWSLSIKTFAALKDLDITYVGDLISYDKIDLLKARNFGNKSLEELTDYMSQYNLNFGTNIKDWNLIRLQLV